MRNHRGFPKTAFTLDWQTHTLRCPNQIVIPFAIAQTVHFSDESCAVCPLRARYLGSRKNLFDPRRSAVVYNLHSLARSDVTTRRLTR